MNLLVAAAVGVLFGTGCYLILKPDLFRVVAGIVLISNAASLALMASGLTRGDPPIAPAGDEPVSDPLVQALTLTALVIGFGVAALLLALAYRVHASLSTVDLDELSRAEVTRTEEVEREELSV